MIKRLKSQHNAERVEFTSGSDGGKRGDPYLSLDEPLLSTLSEVGFLQLEPSYKIPAAIMVQTRRYQTNTTP